MRFRKFISEGGNAIHSSTRIGAKNFKATLEDMFGQVLPLLKLSKSDVRVLGSGGKKADTDTYGDIDIGVPIGEVLKNNNLTTLDEVKNLIKSVLKKVATETKFGEGNLVYSFSWPIVGQENEVAQIDFMLVDDADWANFMYHSPAYYESQWKGIYRNLLLFAVAREAEYKSRKQQDGVDTEWEKVMFNMNSGFFKAVQTNLSASTGKITKTARTIEKQLLSKNPEEVIKILFGDSFSPSDVTSFEKTFAAISSSKFKNAAKRTEIFKFAAKAITENDLPLPKELEQYQ